MRTLPCAPLTHCLGVPRRAKLLLLQAVSHAIDLYLNCLERMQLPVRHCNLVMRTTHHKAAAAAAYTAAYHKIDQCVISLSFYKISLE